MISLRAARRTQVARRGEATGMRSRLPASSPVRGRWPVRWCRIREVIAAPTNVADGFVSGDYTRGGATPGLKGDGTSYLDSGRANDDDLEDDNHNVLWGSTLSVTGIEMGAGSNGVGANNVSQQVSAAVARSRTTSFAQLTRVDVPMLFGHSRSSAGEFKVRYNGATTTEIFASESPSSDNVFLFCRNNGSGTPEQFSPSRIAFYSIGESLDLAAPRRPRHRPSHRNRSRRLMPDDIDPPPLPEDPQTVADLLPPACAI
jgi:hypothetical protein